MYKIITVEDTVRVPPRRFGDDVKEVIISELENSIAGRVDKNLGIILAMTEVQDIGEGKIILGDGAVYYNAVFKVLTYMPQLHEVVEGEVTEITEFGAFVSFGPIDGLIHVSQITEDFMNYDSKNQMFVGKESNKALKVDDKVRARVVTVSLKDRVSESKIGLTMRQPYLGKLEWIAEEAKEREKKEKEAKAKEEEAAEKKEKKSKKKKKGEGG